MGTGGKYADLCDQVRTQTDADSVMVVVYRGIRGDGFSILGSPEFCRAAPSVLRQMADQIEADKQAIRHAMS